MKATIILMAIQTWMIDTMILREDIVKRKVIFDEMFIL